MFCPIQITNLQTLGFRITGWFQPTPWSWILQTPQSDALNPHGENPGFFFTDTFLLEKNHHGLPKSSGSELTLIWTILRACSKHVSGGAISRRFWKKWRMTADPFPFTSCPRETIATLQFFSTNLSFQRLKLGAESFWILNHLYFTKTYQSAEIKRASLKAAFKPTILGCPVGCEGVSRRENSQLDNS